ncbi:MAG: ATP-binding protein, partial [Burkholderiaceae bacterium]|nr:ATP-binding protein [Burkholderiaceae bacterium]
KAELAPEQLAERAQKIRGAVLRMTSVMDNLLTSSRLFDGTPALYFHPAPFDLALMLHDVCHLHREIAAEAQIYERYEALPATFTGDQHLLFQALSNLISNAVKYSPNGGLITVRAAQEEGRLIISIADQGIGIPKDDLPQMFERYHRGSNVSGIAGTGVGLYLVKMVVSLHGGTISVASSERGSTFTMSLPVPAA